MNIFSENVLKQLNDYALSLTHGNKDFADDIIQRMWEKRILPKSIKENRALTLENYNLSFLKTALKYSFLDEWRYRQKFQLNNHHFYHQNKAEVDSEPLIENESDFIYFFNKLRPSDRTFLMQYKVSPKHTVSERKKYSRINASIKANMIYGWIKSKEYFKVNRYRISDSICKLLAEKIIMDDYPLDDIFEIFNFIDYNRLLQTMSGVLYHISIMDEMSRIKINRFMKSKIHSGTLYRGNMTYLSDRILDINSDESLKLFQNYLNLLPEYKGRVSNSTAIQYNQFNISSRCIFDIKKVSTLNEMDTDTTLKKHLIKLFNNESNIDLHRTLTLQLLRFQNDTVLIQQIINSMPNDPDQTNAYYIAKYIRLYAKKNPRLINMQTLNALIKSNEKWPMNRYIRDLKNDIKKIIF